MRVTGFVKDNTVDADVLRAVEPMISPVVISRVPSLTKVVPPGLISYLNGTYNKGTCLAFA